MDRSTQMILQMAVHTRSPNIAISVHADVHTPAKDLEFDTAYWLMKYH